MKTTVNLNDFRQAFKDYGREDQFSYDGLEALFNYIEEGELFGDEEYTLDVIELCCAFSEYDSMEAFQMDYGDEYQTLEDIEYQTIVIMVNDSKFIIQQF